MSNPGKVHHHSRSHQGRRPVQPLFLDHSQAAIGLSDDVRDFRLFPATGRRGLAGRARRPGIATRRPRPGRHLRRRDPRLRTPRLGHPDALAHHRPPRQPPPRPRPAGYHRCPPVATVSGDGHRRTTIDHRSVPGVAHRPTGPRVPSLAVACASVPRTRSRPRRSPARGRRRPAATDPAV